MSTVHSLQSKQNGTTSPQWTGTNDLNIYSSFSYQTSWEIMNISANIRLNKSLETGGELAFFLFSVAYICWQMVLCCWTFWCLLKLFITSKTRRAHLDVYGSRIKEQPGFKLPCVDKKMQQNLWNVIGVLFIFIFFDKSFDSFDEQHKNHFNPDTGTMPRSHP